jgi:hypothetical protein
MREILFCYQIGGRPIMRVFLAWVSAGLLFAAGPVTVESGLPAR